MQSKVSSYRLTIAAGQNVKEYEYWTGKLSGELERSHFPYDFKREKSGGNAALIARQVEKTVIPSPVFQGLMEMSKGKGQEVKLHMILVTGMTILLHHYTHNHDIMIGSPLLKQAMEGEFINTLLVFRNRYEPGANFKDLLMQVKDTVIQANKNQNYPMDILLEQLKIPRPGPENPLFDVVLSLENLYDKRFIREIPYNMGYSFFYTGTGMEVEVEYNAQLYRESTVRQIIRHYLHILGWVAANAEIPLEKLDLLSEEEKKQVLEDFNGIDPESTQETTLHRLFAEQVARTPDNAALIKTNRDITLSYRELYHRAIQWGDLLKSQGVKPDTIVPVIVEPSIEMIVGILAILNAGGAYLPIEPDCPRERIEFILADSSGSVILTTSKFHAMVMGTVWSGDKPGVEKKFIEVIDISAGLSSTTISSHAAPLPASSDAVNRERTGNLAYVIYTSGTTGRPKGILVEHRNVTAYLQAFYREFRITSAEIALELASYAFDVSVEELYPVLLRGGKVVIPDVFEMMDVNAISQVIARHGVTIVDCTPLLLNELNRTAANTPGESPLKTVKTFISGGDVLKEEYVEHLVKTGTVYNTYGPTETTVCAAYYNYSRNYTPGQDEPGKRPGVPIGKPVAGYKIYILGTGLKPLPLGVSGELCITGPGVTRGYLNKPELTLEKFLFLKRSHKHYRSHRTYNLYYSQKGYINLYLTGDLARWQPEGNIEFIGRKDEQVKIRGYRIETGEIENCLLGCWGIKDVVVTAREDEDGDKYLCAYVVEEADIRLESRELREYLARRLPDYMIPAFFMQLPAIPITSNGKVDKKALPPPEINTGTHYVEPQTPLQKGLQTLWQKLLKFEPIGIHDNFFSIGGHSLKGIQLINEIHKELNVKVPLVEIFKSPTIKELAVILEKSAQNSEERFFSLQPVEEKEYYALSSAQKRLYILQHMARENLSYNMPFISILQSRLEKEKLEQALSRLVDRHESFRTSFGMTEKEKEPFQRIHRQVKLDVEYFEGGEAETEELIGSFEKPFDLGKAPLLRVRIAKPAEDRFVLMGDMHHIISDGTSVSLALKELLALLEGQALPPLRLQYKDFSAWQDKEKEKGIIQRQKEYWLKEFTGKVPVLNLPIDYGRAENRDNQENIIEFTIAGSETTLLKQMALAEGATLYIVLQAIYNVMLAKNCDQEDILVGVPVAGRSHADLENIMGFFINTLALRNFPTPIKTFRDFLQEVKEKTLMAFDNQDYPFDDLVDNLLTGREANRDSLIDTIFVFQNFGGVANEIPVISVPGLKLTPHESYKKKEIPFDLVLNGYERKDELYLLFHYRIGLFKEETLRRMITNFKEIITAVLNDKHIQLQDIAVTHGLLELTSGTLSDEQGDFGF